MACRIPAPNYHNREALGIEVDFSLPSEGIIRALDQIIEWRGAPMVIRCDNGPENISGLIQAWAARYGIRLEYIQPGKPQQNAYVERLSARYVTNGCRNTTGKIWMKPAIRHSVDVPLQSLPSKHGLGRIHPKTVVGHGRIALLLKAAKSGGITRF